MTQQLNFETERLFLKLLSKDDADFIFELVNTEGWLKFIGDRNIRSEADALLYIQKILDNKDIIYWLVKLKNDDDKIGIITFIKRDYLQYHDIGFAFLPRYFDKGYAYEAAMKVLEYVIPEYNLTNILATTVTANSSSIKLLTKMGLNFREELEIQNIKLQVYGTSTDKLKF